MTDTGTVKDKVELDRVAFYGRTLGEYQLFFGFDHEKFAGKRALDCPAGAASFVAEATKLGVDAVGVDPLFGLPAESLSGMGVADVAHVLEKVEEAPHLFKWDYYPSTQVLKAYRLTALRRFLHDYETGLAQGRYVHGALPGLPFPDGSFDIVLSAHFLFTYSDRLDYNFHMKSLMELCRVSRGEARVYPLLGLDARQPEFFGDLLSDLGRKGITAMVEPCGFEFQKGSSTRLILSC
ncbi:MAG: methyltransferase domain-containing protein [Nitrospinae bacterium]|nr:methyltransferase domain-containing protein [Nitrospinota bacterium]